MTDQTSTTTERELAKMTLAQMQDVLMARFIGREEATRMGFSPSMLTRIATAISEISRNAVQHSGAQGRIALIDVCRDGRRGLKIIVQDEGRGIDRLQELLQEHAQVSGAGIAGTRRLMDEFLIESAPAAGTKVTMLKWLPPTPPCPAA